MSDAPIRSRRAVLGAALGGAAAVAAQTLARPLPAAATSGDPALIGAANSGDAATSFENTDDGETSLAGIHGAAGTGVDASSVAGTGLNATSTTGPAIMAISTDPTPSDGTADPSHRNGIFAAVGDITDAPTITDEAGVFGYADVSAGSAGVAGQSFQGSGVMGLGDTGVSGFGATQGILAVGSWGVYATGAVGLVGDVNASGVGVYGFTGASRHPQPADGHRRVRAGRVEQPARPSGAGPGEVQPQRPGLDARRDQDRPRVRASARPTRSSSPRCRAPSPGCT